MGMVTCDFEDDLDVSLGDLLGAEINDNEPVSQESVFDSAWMSIGIIYIVPLDVELNVTLDWDEGTFTAAIYAELSDPDGELSGSFETTDGDMLLRTALINAFADLQEFPY